MIQAKLYFVIRRNQANLAEANWVTIVNMVKDILGVNGLPSNKNHWRGNLDTFEVDNGDPEIPNDVYSNEYIFEAQFAEDAAGFASFRDKLVETFSVEPEDITYTTGTQLLRDRATSFATYKYSGTNRLILGLFGWPDENTPATWEQSRQEVLQHLFNNSEDWEEE